MSWQPELDELARREALARAMGGSDKVKRQHDGGRLTVRERIERLLDAGSFHEVGAIAGRASYDGKGDLQGFTPSNCVMGRGLVAGRPVVASALPPRTVKSSPTTTTGRPATSARPITQLDGVKPWRSPLSS